LLWAGFWLANTRLKVEGSVSLTAMFLMASPAALLLLLWRFPAELSLKGFITASYVGAFEMGITFLLWSAALKQAENVSRVANLIFLAPLLSLVLIQATCTVPITRSLKPPSQ
jgi:drug/metabolite transporter (DMT)-like permease